MEFIILWVLVGEGHFEKAGQYTTMQACNQEAMIQSVSEESRGNTHYSFACVSDSANWPAIFDRVSGYEEEHRS